MKAAVDNMETNGQDCVPIKRHLQKQQPGISPWAIVCHPHSTLYIQEQEDLRCSIKANIKGNFYSTIRVIQGRLGGSEHWASAFGSGHDPGVLGSSPASGFLLSGSLLLPLPLPLLVFPLSLCLSQINK